MSGLRKPKKYDWKDSNLSLFGSDIEKNVKRDSAEGEPAWKGAGTKVGVQIWRIVKFKVTHLPKEDYGNFFNGDSYIVLNTYKKDPNSEELSYDVHFWIGKESTQDEYGTAAYKTVELDTFLNDKPVQHREVQGHESKLFKSYFDPFVMLKGGADTGFKRVLPEAYTPRMMQFTRDEQRKVSVIEKAMKRSNMSDGDVFIVDLGREIFQLNGAECDKDEKFSAQQYVQNLESERCGKAKSHTIDVESMSNLPPKLKSVIPEGKPKKDKAAKKHLEKVLNKVSDESGHLECEEVARGSAVSLSCLNPNDVFILSTDDHCYVWVGNEASVDERRKAMEYAHNFLRTSEDPFRPISVIKGGDEPDSFNKAF